MAYHEPVLPWSDFFECPGIPGMILKMIQPHGARPIWGEIVSARVLVSSEVEFTLAWTSSTSPYAPRRVPRRMVTKLFVFQPLYGGPFYYPKKSVFRLYDAAPGLVHLILPPVGSAALVREADWKD